MTVRVAEQLIPVLDRLDDIDPETDAQSEHLERAVEHVTATIEDDEDRHGPAPSKRLLKRIGAADKCLNPDCDTDVGDGGWCSWSCFQNTAMGGET